VTNISYTVEVDKETLKQAQSLFEFVGGNTDDALRVAINRTGKKVRTLASRKIREQVNLKAAYVNGRLGFIGATRGKLEGSITTEARGILLTRYSTDSRIKSNGEKYQYFKPPPIPARGIRVKVKPSGSTKALSRQSFYMILKDSKALGIVQRTPDRKYDVLYGPSTSQVFNDVRDQVLPEAGKIYTDELLDAMRFLLTKRFPKE
jgi:hypothetical protein